METHNIIILTAAEVRGVLEEKFPGFKCGEAGTSKVVLEQKTAEELFIFSEKNPTTGEETPETLIVKFLELFAKDPERPHRLGFSDDSFADAREDYKDSPDTERIFSTSEWSLLDGDRPYKFWAYNYAYVPDMLCLASEEKWQVVFDYYKTRPLPLDKIEGFEND